MTGDRVYFMQKKEDLKKKTKLGGIQFKILFKFSFLKLNTVLPAKFLRGFTNQFKEQLMNTFGPLSIRPQKMAIR